MSARMFVEKSYFPNLKSHGLWYQGINTIICTYLVQIVSLKNCLIIIYEALQIIFINTYNY